jgi:hypothetical protein
MTHDLTRYLTLAERIPELDLADWCPVYNADGSFRHWSNENPYNYYQMHRCPDETYYEAIGRMARWLMEPPDGRALVVRRPDASLYDDLCEACELVLALLRRAESGNMPWG